MGKREAELQSCRAASAPHTLPLMVLVLCTMAPSLLDPQGRRWWRVRALPSNKGAPVLPSMLLQELELHQCMWGTPSTPGGESSSGCCARCQKSSH